jgi:hypothetical protein
VGLCPDAGPWDVTACVPGASGEVPWSLENVLDPARPDRITGRFEVHQGDQGARGGGDRCELVEQTRDITGMDPAPDALPMEGGEVRVFKFQALYDASTQLPTTWQYQTVGQWHNSTNAWGCPTSSPLKIAITGPGDAKSLQVVAQECRGGLTYPERILYSTPLVTDTWQSWSFEIRWSPDPRTGYVRNLHQGRPVVPAGCPTDGRCPMATQYSDLRGVAVRNHFKLGNYRDKDITVPTVVSYRAVTISLPG